MKKNLLFTITLLFAMQMMIGQITILGPTFVKTHTPSITYGSWIDDPLDNSGKIWVIPDFTSSNNKVYEYSSMANLISNTIAFTYTLPSTALFDGTGHVVYGGYLYYNKANSNNLVKYSLATQSVVLDVPLTGAGFHNTYHYQWGGYSDIDFAIDENGLHVIYSTAANGGNIVISKLNPNTLLPITTWTTTTPKACGNAFMAQGVNYSVANWSNINTTLNYQYNTLTSSGAASAITFTNGSSYLTSLVYNPSTKILFAWNNSGLYTYTVVPSHSISTTQISNTSVCAGNTINVSFNAVGTYSAGNTFTAQLSDASGSFTNAITNIGTLTSSVSGVITATIPLATPTGTAYRIRIASNGPGIIGISSNTLLSVSQSPSLTVIATTNTLCKGSSAVLTATGATTYTWNTTATTASISVTPSVNTTYTVTGENTPGCSSNALITLSVSPTPTINIAGTGTICQGASITLTVSGADTYTWNTSSNNTTITVSPSVTTVYTANGTFTSTGCANQSSVSVIVNSCVGLSEIGLNTLFNIYPNPSTGKFFVKTSGTSQKSFEVSDYTGKILLTITSNSTDQEINLENYPTGLYFIKVSVNNKEQVQKIIKH